MNAVSAKCKLNRGVHHNMIVAAEGSGLFSDYNLQGEEGFQLMVVAFHLPSWKIQHIVSNVVKIHSKKLAQ